MPPVQSKLFTLPQPPASCATIVRRLEALPDKVGKFPDDVEQLPPHVKKFAGQEILPLTLICTLLKSNAHTKRGLTKAVRSCVGIDERTRKGGNSTKWCSSPERRQFYDNHPADQESTDLTKLLEAEGVGEWTGSRRKLVVLMVQLFEERNLISFDAIKNSIQHTASKAHERSKDEKWAELLIELCMFYSWFYERGRHAHVWLLLARPTVAQITSFQHTQTTYVFRKDHEHDVAAVLGQIARTLNIDETSFKRLMHVLAKTAKEVKKEEEKKLVQLVEHAWVVLAKDDRATQRPAELRPLLAAAAGRVNGVVKELRRRSGYHVAFSSAEIEVAVKFLVHLAKSNSKLRPKDQIKLSREALKDAINDKSKYERTAQQIKDLLKNQRLPLMLAVQKAGFDLSLVWRDDLIEKAGFVQDEEAPTGWVHPSAVHDEDEDMVDDDDDDDEAKEEDEEMGGEEEEEEENPFEGLLTLDGMLENDDFDELDDELNPDDGKEEEE